MRIHMSIRNKMMFRIVGVASLAYVLTLSYLSYSIRQETLREGERLLEVIAEKKAGQVGADLREGLVLSKTLAMAISDLLQSSQTAESLPIMDNLMESIIRSNRRFVSVDVDLELSLVAPNDAKANGYLKNSVSINSNGRVQRDQSRIDAGGGDRSGGYYYDIKANPRESIGGPVRPRGDEFFSVPIWAPISIDGSFAGVAGVSLLLDNQDDLFQLDDMETGTVFLVSNTGKVLSHSESSFIGNPLDSLTFYKSLDANMKQKIANSDTLRETVYDPYFDDDALMIMVPVGYSQGQAQWSLVVEVPTSEITRSVDKIFITTFIVGLLGLVVMVFLLYQFSVRIVNWVKKSNEVLKTLAEGDLNVEVELDERAGGEFGELAISLNKLINELKQKADFSFQIGSGNLEVDFIAAGEKDILGQSLLKMRENLKLVISETKDVIIRAGEYGELSEARIQRDWEEGAWKELSHSTNTLLDTISLQFSRITNVINALAEGDLSVRFTHEARGDIQVMAESLNKALTNLGELIRRISNGAQLVDESSSEMLAVSEEMTVNTREIASSISEMSSGAQNQVVKVDESSNLVEGILQSFSDMEQHAEGINKAAQEGVDSSEEGQKLVRKVGFSMRDIAAFSSDTYDSIQVLTKRSNEISTALGLITDIASQTNLLALNAAIEAAQAGDAGRGFAVVAEEIRKLAEDSKRSAKDIERLVVDVKNDVGTASQAIDMMKTSVKNGEEATNLASEAFNAITGSSKRTLTISEEIRDRVQQQIDSIKNVVAITESVVVIAEETAAGTEEIASSAAQLSSGMDNYVKQSGQLTKVATELFEQVTRFRL